MVLLSFNSWPLGRQLKINFIASSLFVSISLIILTNYLLQWLQSEMTSNYSNLLQTTIKDQMNVLCQEEVGYITQEFITFRKCVEKLHDIERLVLGFTSVPIPIVPNPPIQDTVYLSTDMDYTTGCFMSRFSELSQAGKDLEAKEAAMDKIYPMLYNPNYL